MKAIVQGKLGPAWFVRLNEVENPVPKDHEVLVRVMASSLNFADVLLIKGGPWFARPVTMFIKPGIQVPRDQYGRPGGSGWPPGYTVQGGR